jgi:hypothetical protein
MSSENSMLTGESVAVAYLAQEIPAARKTLQRTRVIGIALIIFIALYIGTITTVMVKFFEPKAAAEVASGMLVQRVVNEGPTLAAHVEREIPQLIREVPDFLIKGIPDFRKQLQVSLSADCEAYCNTLSKDWGVQMDKFIDGHKPEIRTLLENADARGAIRRTIPDFGNAINDTIKINYEGQAIKEHIDEWAAALKEVEKRVDRLANARDLTPEEIKARHALAMLSTVAKNTTQLPDNSGAVAVKK